MKLIKKIFILFLFVICISNINAQEDFDVRISEAEINEALEEKQ